MLGTSSKLNFIIIIGPPEQFLFHEKKCLLKKILTLLSELSSLDLLKEVKIL